jgi:hypothetical protein
LFHQDYFGSAAKAVNQIARRALDQMGQFSRSVAVMIVFEIVKEPFGWAVRRDESMMMPATCRAAAIAAAEQMVRALRGLGCPARLQCHGSPDPT